jgi:hypothetical protein
LHNYSGEAGLAQLRLDQLGLPRFDVFVGRCGDDEIAYVIGGDQRDVIGPLAAACGDKA